MFVRKIACVLLYILLTEVHVLARPNLQSEGETEQEAVSEVQVEEGTAPPQEAPAQEGETDGEGVPALRSVTLQYPPAVYSPPFYVPLSYSCLPGDVVILEVLVDTDLSTNVRIFSKTFKCEVADNRLIYVHLDLPSQVTYRPDALNRLSLNIHNGVVSLWIVNENDYWPGRTLNRIKQFALVTETFELKFVQPFKRPPRNELKLEKICFSWGAEMMLLTPVEHYLQCLPETGPIQLAYFPIALTGDNTGVSKIVGKVKDPHQRHYFKTERNFPKFTFSLFLYIKEYCQYQLCSLYHRKTFFSNKYITPLAFITPQGKTHFQITQHDGQYLSMLNHLILPKNEWFRMTIRMNGVIWTITCQFANLTRFHISGQGALFPEPVQYADDDGFTHLGGSDAVRAFKGYIADVKLWRQQLKAPKKLTFPNASHPVHTINLQEYYETCVNLHVKLSWTFKSYLEVITNYQKRVTCPSFEEYVHSFKEIPNFCTARVKVSVPRDLKFLFRSLRRSVSFTRFYDSQAKPIIGGMLFKETQRILKYSGLARHEEVVNLLKQASCFGQDEASAQLGAMYYAGLGATKDEVKGTLYTLIAAQEGNIIAMSTLGYRHLYGVGNLDADDDYAYYYLKSVADDTVKEKEKHAGSAVSTEFVRLTDTTQLQYHSGEKGDYFRWMKFQASKGITDAQANMGRVLYWGSGGVKRNLQAATKYYERTANDDPENAVALYDYGVVLLRGQGTDKDVPKALEQLNKSASLGHGPAYTALGWYKLNKEKNYTAAAKYFEKGDHLGHRDASHNLGYMHLNGKYPGKDKKDRATALKYFKRAADAGHLDSGAVLAKLYSEGSEKIPPNRDIAARWAFRVAVQHGDFGLLLRKALESYMGTSWDESMLYYLMAAEAGLEVAQYNLAYLCEENYEGLADKYFYRGCQWKYYEYASLSENPHANTLLKMGEYYWYGHGGTNDTELAVGYYVSAAHNQLPEAIFNLGYISESGVQIPRQYLKSLGVKKPVYQGNDTEEVALSLYRICRDHNSGEAYIPCGLALLRLQMLQLYRNHPYACQLSTCLIAAGIIGLIVAGVTTYYARQKSEKERQESTSLYHTLHNGNPNYGGSTSTSCGPAPRGNRNSGSSGGNSQNASVGGEKPPTNPPRRRQLIVTSEVDETNGQVESASVEATIEVATLGSGSPNGDITCDDGVTTGKLVAPTVLDSEDPLLQAKVTRLPEAVRLEEDTDLHQRTFTGSSDDEEEEEEPVTASV